MPDQTISIKYQLIRNTFIEGTGAWPYHSIIKVTATSCTDAPCMYSLATQIKDCITHRNNNYFIVSAEGT